jgi:hypothetical protein
MAWSGGSFTKANAATGGWVGDASLGIGIEAGRHDNQDNDFATGINQCLNKDGSNAATGNLNLGGFLPTNIGAGTAAAPAICAGNDVNTGIFAPASDQIGIATNGSERVRIDATGRVGIGTTAPYSSLDVLDSFQIGASATATNNFHITANGSGGFAGNLIFWNGNNGAGTERMRITANGRLGIGITPTSYVHIQNNESNSINSLNVTSNVAGDVSTAATIFVKKDNNSTTSQVFAQFLMNGAASGSGQINANGALQVAFGSYSDERLKENITVLPSQLASILALRPVEFDYKDGAGHQIGFIAQEVQEVYPDLVGEGQDGFLTLSGLGKNEARMIKAFQEFAQITQAKIEALEARLAELEA